MKINNNIYINYNVVFQQGFKSVSVRTVFIQ